MTKPKTAPPWPAPDAAPELRSLAHVLQHVPYSEATWNRQPDKPEPVLVSPRLKMYWTHEVDRFLAALPRAGEPKPPVPPAAVPEPRRKRGRPRRHSLASTSPPVE